MLGGGTFVTQNKVLPGTYMNFVSVARASAMIGGRGKAALAVPLSWGNDDSVFEVTAEEFRTDCLQYFGMTYDSDEAKGSDAVSVSRFHVTNPLSVALNSSTDRTFAE